MGNVLGIVDTFLVNYEGFFSNYNLSIVVEYSRLSQCIAGNS